MQPLFGFTINTKILIIQQQLLLQRQQRHQL